MKKAILAAVAFSAAPLFADSVTSVDMQGFYNTVQGKIVACSGSGPCDTPMTTPTFSTPYTGPVQFSAGFYGQTSFGLGSDANEDSAYGFSGNQIPADSYYLSANLGVWQGFDYNTPSQDLNPKLNMHAVFNMPVDSGDWTIQAYFYEYGDAVNQYSPADTAAITYNGQQYMLINTCTSSQWGQGASCGADNATFTLQHTPGTSGQIVFDASAYAGVWGTDTAIFQSILTDPMADASPTPEPASAYLLLGGLLLLAGRKFGEAGK